MDTDTAAMRRTAPLVEPDGAIADDPGAVDLLTEDLRAHLFASRLAAWLADVALGASTDEEDLSDDPA